MGEHLDAIEIKQATKILQLGGIISYPTEGVWGLGCDPYNEAAVEKILSLKTRSVDKGLILVASSLAQINSLLTPLTKEQQKFLREVWPGTETWLLPDTNQIIPVWIKGKFKTVAVRVSVHPIVKALCDSFGGLLVSTSANPGSQLPAKTKEQVFAYFQQRIDGYVSGDLGAGIGPSVIKDLGSDGIIRK